MKRGWLSENRDAVEDAAMIVGLVAVQFLYGTNSILLSYMLRLGFQPSSLIVFSSLATFLLLAPLAVLFERKQWPKRMGGKFFVQLLVLSFGGVTLFQSLFMKGVSLTSPAMATAMPNLAPGLIFLIAWASRLERIDLGCIYSRAKVAGTFLCVFGAVAMSLMQCAPNSSIEPELSISPSPTHDNIVLADQTVTGCMYLIASVLVMSSQAVLQALTLHDFPAPVSLCALTALIGALTTAMVEVFEDGSMERLGWPFMTIEDMLLYAIWTGSVSGTCVSVNAWATKRRGPVIVSIFNPLGTVVAAVFSVIALGESICVGSLGGMCLMFTGLYCVLWAKRREGFFECSNDEPDLEKPLLV